jgi:hypothetical protein
MCSPLKSQETSRNHKHRRTRSQTCSGHTCHLRPQKPLLPHPRSCWMFPASSNRGNRSNGLVPKQGWAASIVLKWMISDSDRSGDILIPFVRPQLQSKKSSRFTPMTRTRTYKPQPRHQVKINMTTLLEQQRSQRPYQVRYVASLPRTSRPLWCFSSSCKGDDIWGPVIRSWFNLSTGLYVTHENASLFALISCIPLPLTIWPTVGTTACITWIL